MGVGVKGRAALLPLAWPAPAPALPLRRGVVKPAKPVQVPGPNGRAQGCRSRKGRGTAGVWDRKDSKRLHPAAGPGQRSLQQPGVRVGAPC